MGKRVQEIQKPVRGFQIQVTEVYELPVFVRSFTRYTVDIEPDKH